MAALPPCAGSFPWARFPCNALWHLLIAVLGSGIQVSQNMRPVTRSIVPHVWQFWDRLPEGACASLRWRRRTAFRPARRLASVNGVGSRIGRRGRVWSSPCVARSAIGAKARAHREAVSASSRVSGGSTRHTPSRVSKNSSYRNTRLDRVSKTNASTADRTGSMRSQARESRDLRSACNNPSPGSHPTARAASRASASTTA